MLNKRLETKLEQSAEGLVYGYSPPAPSDSVWNHSGLFQQLIHAAQNQPDCADAKFLVMTYQHQCGLGSYIHVTAGQLLMALDHDLVSLCEVHHAFRVCTI